MDTTTTSTVGGSEDAFIFNTGYVSCMKVDGHPILPPLMTEKRREEMRRYKEQAIITEKKLKERRVNNITFQITRPSTTTTSSNSKESTALLQKQLIPEVVPTSAISPNLVDVRSPLFSPSGAGVPVTSTPRPRRTYSKEKLILQEEKSRIDVQPQDSTDVGFLREMETAVPKFDFDKSMSSVPSVDDNASTGSYDGDEEKVDADERNDSDSCSHQSEDNFASAASSTGTFVIKRSSDNKSSENSLRKTPLIETSSEEEQENGKNCPPPTVIRKPSVDDQGFKRKRPAKYFDLDDEEEDVDKSKCSTSTFSSIPNHVPGNQSENYTTSLVADSTGTSSKFSPVPVTNFSLIAKSLTIEFTKKFCSTSEFSSTQTTAQRMDNSNSKYRNSGGSYDVRLSKDIPSSAEEDIKAGDDDVISNSSDKENINSSGNNTQHVRKLSYTLANPSAALLEAYSKSNDKPFAQTLDTVPSVPSSVGIQSAQPTPEKSSLRGAGDASLNSRNLSEMCLSKQAHLERFLGEQENFGKSAPLASNISPPAAHVAQEMQDILKKMQEEYEAQMRHLAEQHRMQELKMKKEFESEMEKLKDKFSSTLNTTDSSRSLYKTSPNSLVDSVTSARSNANASEMKSPLFPTSTCEDSTVNTTNSGRATASHQSLASQSIKIKESSVFHFTGGGESQSSSTTTFINSTHHGGPCELTGVGLSKLQSRMQLMSPKMFRTPVDARSPLLKGLVFLDPLDKPNKPLRIPQKALDPLMKPKFDRISASVKGYLIRRLLNTEKVQIIVQTIRDTVDLLLKLYEEAPSASGNTPCVKPQDNELHQRLIQQLTGACRSFHDVFFKLSTKERMAIIATDREKIKAKALRQLSSPAKPNISNATLKSIERRMSHRSSPKRDNRKIRSSSTKPSDLHQGSQSVKPKSVKLFNISPKRRRMSFWDDKNSVDARSVSTATAGKQDLNGNNFRMPVSRSHYTLSRSPGSQRNHHLPEGIGETFIVPSSLQSQAQRSTLSSFNSGSSLKSNSGRRDSSAAPNTKSISARSTQSSISVASSSSGVNRSRASTSRQPWNSGRRKL